MNIRRGYLTRGNVTYLYLSALGYTRLMNDDLARLRREYPAWNFGSVCATAGSGPDSRRLWAARDGMLLSAWTAAELAAVIRREDDAGQRGRA